VLSDIPWLSHVQNSCLKRLNLAHSVFTEALSLCCALHVMKRLTNLELGNSMLQNDGVRDVCKALSSRGSLLELGSAQRSAMVRDG
jgi:hypothetical protein